MITQLLPTPPVLPAGNETPGPIWTGDLYRFLMQFQEATTRRAKWLESLMDLHVTNSTAAQKHSVLGRKIGTHLLTASTQPPWTFNTTSDGNAWYPSRSRLIAATPGTSGVYGLLGGVYQPTAGGFLFDEVTVDNPLPLSPTARTFYVKVTVDLDAEYFPGDFYTPGVPVSVEVVDRLIFALPVDDFGVYFLPWCDIPAATGGARIPTYHFSLWGRFALYHTWHQFEEGEEGGGGEESPLPGGKSIVV
jgi:hypothetical protein